MLPGDPVARTPAGGACIRAEAANVELAASLEERNRSAARHRGGPESERAQLIPRARGESTPTSSAGRTTRIDAFERLRLLVPADTRRAGPARGPLRRGRPVVEGDRDAEPGGEIAEGTPESSDALRAIARIYERELELPERAIESYNQLVADLARRHRGVDGRSTRCTPATRGGPSSPTCCAGALRSQREPAERAALLPGAARSWRLAERARGGRRGAAPRADDRARRPAARRPAGGRAGPRPAATARLPPILGADRCADLRRARSTARRPARSPRCGSGWPSSSSSGSTTAPPPRRAIEQAARAGARAPDRARPCSPAGLA